MLHTFLLTLAVSCSAGMFGLLALKIKWRNITDEHMLLLFIMGMLTVVFAIAAALTH
jgi:hypothetical protein